jgi:hypothetical protein
MTHKIAIKGYRYPLAERLPKGFQTCHLPGAYHPHQPEVGEAEAEWGSRRGGLAVGARLQRRRLL